MDTDNRTNSGNKFNFTGAKLLVEDNDDNYEEDAAVEKRQNHTNTYDAFQWVREKDQLDPTSLGRARLKPMRSDMPASQQTRSMCCSDKLCRTILVYKAVYSHL